MNSIQSINNEGICGVTHKEKEKENTYIPGQINSPLNSIGLLKLIILYFVIK